MPLDDTEVLTKSMHAMAEGRMSDYRWGSKYLDGMEGVIVME